VLRSWPGAPGAPRASTFARRSCGTSRIWKIFIWPSALWSAFATERKARFSWKMSWNAMAWKNEVSPASNLIREFSFVKKLPQPLQTFLELWFGRNEADHEITIPRKIEEVAGVDQHGTGFKKRNGEVFIRSRDRHAQNGVPAAFATEGREGLRFAQHAVQ